MLVTPIWDEVSLFLCNPHMYDFSHPFRLLLLDWVSLKQGVCLCGGWVCVISIGCGPSSLLACTILYNHHEMRVVVYTIMPFA